MNDRKVTITVPLIGIAHDDNGGYTLSDGTKLTFSNPSKGRAGVTLEEIIAVLRHRLTAVNEALPCRENSLAITNIEQASLWLGGRTLQRQIQGVEGTSTPHVSA